MWWKEHEDLVESEPDVPSHHISVEYRSRNESGSSDEFLSVAPQYVHCQGHQGNLAEDEGVWPFLNGERHDGIGLKRVTTQYPQECEERIQKVQDNKPSEPPIE